MGAKGKNDGTGADWLVATVGTAQYAGTKAGHYNGTGVAVASIATSHLVGATKVLLIGFYVATGAAAGVAQVIDAAGNAIPGLLMTMAATTAPGLYLFGEDGVIWAPPAGTYSNGAVVGITLSGASNAVSLVYLAL